MTEFPAYQAPPPHRSRPGPPAESLRSRSTGVVILVAVAACVNVLISAATAIDWTPEPYAQSGRNPLNFWSVLLYLAAGLAFIEWERRARENMERLGDQRPRWAIGWTRGGWLIPGLNLVIPILVLREIDKASAQAAVAARQ